MGYGEYDGGGSVEWHVEHTKGASASVSVNAQGPSWAKGKDDDPPRGEGAKMAVWINGVKLPTIECEGSKVVVAWGEEALGAVPPIRRNPGSAPGA